MYLNVKAELARQNLSVVDLANKTGIRYQTLVEKLNGKHPMTLDEAKNIKAVLGVDLSMEELFARSV